MKQARLIVIGAALLSAATTAFLATRILNRPAQPVQQVQQKTSSVRVLVAKNSIPLGETLGEQHVLWQSWPEGTTNPSWIVDNSGTGIAKGEVIGLLARASFAPGEPLTRSKLLKQSEGGVMAAILPAGMRAISTPIKEETAAGNFILPNDRVDVMLTRRMRSRQGGGDDHVVRTLLRNIRVLAIGQNKKSKEKGDTAAGKTATLELTPQQSELLTQARSMGVITLALRPLKDAKLSAEEEAKTNSLLGESSNGLKVLRYGVSSRNFDVK